MRWPPWYPPREGLTADVDHSPVCGQRSRQRSNGLLQHPLARDPLIRNDGRIEALGLADSDGKHAQLGGEPHDRKAVGDTWWPVGAVEDDGFYSRPHVPKCAGRLG